MSNEAQQTPAAPAPPPAAKPWYDPFLAFFSSVHVAVVILILLATISIIGTVLQQEGIADVTDNLRIYEAFVSNFTDNHDRAHAVAERLYAFSERIGFFNLYRTWYFYTLLGLLSTSLVVCSLRRWPRTWQVVARPKIELEEPALKASPNRRALAVRAPLGEVAAAVEGGLGKAGYRVRRSERDGALYLYGQKGVYSRLGLYVTHLSVLVIFVGGLIGNIYGFKGYMQITEGEAGDTITLRGKAGGRLPLGFQVRCDDFTVETYPGTGQPKDYYSRLTVIDGGREVKTQRIEVNSPLVYDDIWFYQSSYGETGRGMKLRVRVADPASGRSETLEIDNTAVHPVPGMDVGIQVQQVYPDFAMEGGRPVSRSNQPRNPVVQARVVMPDGSSVPTYLFALRPDIRMVENLPVDLAFLGMEGLQYTGLQVVYDPGVWVIWLGCTIMVIGLYLAFFTSHRRVWARLREEGGAASVALAGNANKNREAFAEEFERVGGGLQALAEARK